MRRSKLASITVWNHTSPRPSSTSSRFETASEDIQRRIDDEIRATEGSGDISNLSTAAIERITKSILLTTESVIMDCVVENRLGIVTAECVFGMNIFRDLFASVVDVFGGRSAATQKVLRDARNVCLLELKREALLLGANGVIAVSLAYSEMSGGGKVGMIFLVASGTAVKLRPSGA